MIRAFEFRSLLVKLIILLATLLFSSTFTTAANPPLDQSSEISAALQQRNETAVIANKVARLVAGGEYQEAENNLREVLQKRALSSDGMRELEKVYYQLSTMEQLRAWNRWCSSRPASHFPYLVRGMYFLERARFLDGANKSLLLSEQQRRDFNQFLLNGRANLEKAAELSASDPGPFAALTALSIHLKLPRAEMEKWFQRAVDIDPGWLAAYRAKLLYLSPWWYGSDQMMEQFARNSFNLESSDVSTYVVYLDYLKLRSDRLGRGLQKEQFLLAPETYQMMSKGLDRYLVDYPTSPAINIYLDLKERALDDPYVAIAAFSDTLNNSPDDVDSRKGRILAYIKNRQFREAEEDLVYLEKLQGKTGFSRFHLGSIVFQAGQDLERAHLLIDDAIGLESSGYRRKNYYYQRAEFYRQLGRQPEAIADYSAAIDQDILYEEAYYGRAQSLHAQGHLEGGLADLVIIKSSIRGRMTTKARSLINAYLKKPVGHVATSGSESVRLPSNQLSPTPEKEIESGLDNGHREFLIRGLRRYYENNIEAARRDFYRVISHEPDNAKAYFMLGEIAAQHDFNQVEACVFYRQAYRLAQDTPDYLIELSRCLYRQRSFSDAIALLSNFINDPELPAIEAALLAQIHFLRGSCLEESGLMPEAVEDMQKALTHDPELKAAALFIRDHSAETKEETETSLVIAPLSTTSEFSPREAEAAKLLEVGRQQLLEGDITGAKVSFLRVIRLNPEASSAYHQLGRLYFEHEQNYEKARIYYSQAIDKDDGVAHYYFDRAAIHFFFKRYDLARDDFTRVLELHPLDSRSLYYRGVCSHFLGEIEAARRDFQSLRQSDEVWNVEIERFRNAWQAEINQFLENTL
ncbi:MAG: tetratricopeptide repeat protein [Desulfofustis sp.]|nr:tetratricopeptide repeat protein [Desulfofustis sp.]